MLMKIVISESALSFMVVVVVANVQKSTVKTFPAFSSKPPCLRILTIIIHKTVKLYINNYLKLRYF